MKILITASQGGHTARAIAIAEQNQQQDLAFITEKGDPYESTLIGLGRIHHMTKPARLNESKYKIHRLATAYVQAGAILAKEKPDTLIGCGSNYMVPPITVAKMLYPKTRIIATESFVEIGQPSKALAKVAKQTDEIWVQWPEQLGYFPNTRYVGLLIPKRGTSGLKDGETTYPSTKLMKAIQEGLKVRAEARPDLDREKQERFITFLKQKEMLDEDGWTKPTSDPQQPRKSRYTYPWASRRNLP